uniref:Type I polyketide synthase n=1 Tax=Gambierdiscus polynesiensis TaxID=439318 RepID=A0A1S6K820_9DINO|nr:type I polyketide synthase [Gambierdiscus polynesiensis]
MALSTLGSGEVLRPGTLVQTSGSAEEAGKEELVGQLGQILSYDHEADVFKVCTVDGGEGTFKASNLKLPDNLKRPGVGGAAESFDVLLGPRLQEDLLAEEIASCLFEKGFCVMRVCQRREDVEQAFLSVKELAHAGKLQRLPEEIEEGYLGNGNRGKIAWLDPDDKDTQHGLLKKSDAFISTIAALIQPFCADTIGKTVDERSPGLLSLSLTDDEEADYPPQDATDAILGSFLGTWRRSLLRVVHFMGPGTGAVTLEVSEEGDGKSLPFKQETVDINALPNTILIFRKGVFNYSCHYEEESLSLSSEFLEQTGPLVVTEWDGDARWLRFGEGPPGPNEENINVVNLSSRLMACWDEPEMYRSGLYGGCDAGQLIPITRWDVNFYFNPDSDAVLPWQTSTKHMSVVEGIELFDNKYFEIIVSEARSMDPMQRHVLEVGAHNLFKMGITKKYSNRNPHHAGCSVGLDKDDWDRVPDKLYEGGQNVQAIISNRFSFIFNLRGPNFVADTACSASLCATHLAKFTLVDRVIDKVEFHVALGIHQCLSPLPFVGCSQTHMTSPIGRCLTFNASAGGYMRGDGCSGMTLKFGYLPDDRDAIWRASQCGQNGRSATLTAPNGLAQEDVIWKSIREAKITPPESCVWNCHGTGTSLGDPIEVGAVRKVQIKQERPTTLVVTSNKTHTGHLEGGAAMTSLIGAVTQVMMGCAIPVCHFRQLNPHLESSAFDAFFNDGMNSYHYTQGNVHVSSFGFGGTNGHVIFWGEAVLATVADVETLFARRLRKMAPPEVRVNGNDPSLWEWDGPDKDVKKGDKYTITLRSDEPLDTPVKWIKEEDGEAIEDGEDETYVITGPFCDWQGEMMEDGPITGMRSITLEVPDSGALEFRFLRNGEEDEVIYPSIDKCTKRSTPILGPKKEDKGLEKNVWSVEGTPGTSIKIDLFMCRAKRSLMWMAV